MSYAGVLALRALAGGALVVVFALVGEVVTPKAFAGLFAAAPSVAVASLAITIAAESPAEARQSSIGMVIGAVAMTVCCILAAVAIPRVRAFWGSVAAWLGWAVAGLGLYWAVFVGAR
jgi:hypothetical protein